MIQISFPGKQAFTLDESLFFQNAVNSAGIPGDADDDDFSGVLDPTFDTLLFTTLGLGSAFPDGGRIARSASNFIVVSSDGQITDIGLAGEYDPATMTSSPLAVYDGTNFAAGGATGFPNDLTTIDGEDIHLFSDILADPADPSSGVAAAAGLEGNIVFGIDESGDIVLALLMEETIVNGDVHLRFTEVTFEAFTHGDPTDDDDALDLGDFLSLTVQEASGFNFLGAPPGKSMELTAAAETGPGGILITPLTEVIQINTSNAFPNGAIGFGSQGINSGETVVVTYIADGLVPGLTIPNLDQNEADDPTSIRFNNLDAVTGGSFAIVQKVGSATAALKITALATNVEDGTGSGDFFDHIGNASLGTTGDDTQVNINFVRVETAAGVLRNEASGGTSSANGLTLAFVGGVVTITGLNTGDTIDYTTISPAARLLITGVSGNIDVGSFSNTQTGSAAFPIGDAFLIEDAAPTAAVIADIDPGELAALSRNLDETIDPDQDQTANGADNLAAGEVPDGNGDLDDVLIDVGGGTLEANTAIYSETPAGFDAPISQAIGELRSDSVVAGGLAALFDTSGSTFGTDGEGDFGSGSGRTDTLSFAMPTTPVQSNLVATAVVGSVIEDYSETERTIWLHKVSDTVIEGRIAGKAAVPNDEFVIIRITIDNADDPSLAALVYENFAPVQHPDPTLFDEELSVRTVNPQEVVNLRYTVDLKDADGDEDDASAEVTLISTTSSVVSIDDDGPRAVDAGQDVPLWEDGLPGGNTDADGEPELITNAIPVDLSLQVIGGSDGVKDFGLVDDTSSLPLLSSNGVPLVYAVERDFGGGTDDRLIATAGPGGAVIFTVVVSQDGLATATLSGPLDHAQGLLGQPDEDEIAVDLTDLLEAFEGDNDPVAFLPQALRLVIEDDAPDISPLIGDVVVPFQNGAVSEQTGFLSYGADGPGSFVITGFDDLPDTTPLGTITGALSAGNTVLTYTSSLFGDLFTVTLDDNAPGGARVDVLQDPPLILNPLDLAGVDAGGPVEQEVVLGANGLQVTFDGFLSTNFNAASLKDEFNAGDKEIPDPQAALDDVNISDRGVGIDDQQIDPAEALAMFFDQPVEGVRMLFDGGTGSGGTFDIRLQAFDNGTLIHTEFFDDETLPKGNKELLLDFLPGTSFNQLYTVVEFQNSNNGVRIAEVLTFDRADIPDFQTEIDVRAEDFDGDQFDDTFLVGIDSNLDGDANDVV